MTIIVTGGAGFIGSNFIFYMMKKYPDYRIICLDKLTYAGNLFTLAPVMDKPNFRFVKMDICDREAVYGLFEEEHPDVVVNFAAESHVDRSILNPEIFLETNIIGTSVLMDACRKYGIGRYHQVSTSLWRLAAGQTGSFLYGKDSPSYQLSLQQLQGRSGSSGGGVSPDVWAAGDDFPLQQ